MAEITWSVNDGEEDSIYHRLMDTFHDELTHRKEGGER